MSSAPDCHPDLATVAALRQEPVLTRVPPGARGLLVKETVSCGWAGSAPPALGMLDSEVTGGDSDDVARFYTDLAGSSGWQTFGGGDQLYSGAKPDGTDCTWQLQVVSTAERTYHVRITYTPRDLRPTCL
ncbi:hypothetical protein [Asanoa ferruginea]|nr:hypothetical protein [Asanoa ferruginea]